MKQLGESKLGNLAVSKISTLYSLFTVDCKIAIVIFILKPSEDDVGIG